MGYSFVRNSNRFIRHKLAHQCLGICFKSYNYCNMDGRRVATCRMERSGLEPLSEGNIVLYSWIGHFTLTLPLSTQVYKWVPAKET